MLAVSKNVSNLLTVIIHTEEEFDWNSGFFRLNNQVTHAAELIHFAEQIIETGVDLVLAMDYAFVTSHQGSQVIEHFKVKKYSNFKFASHLHPWVNPPFDEPTIDGNKIEEFYSYPGNLPEALEEAKLAALTEIIEQKTGTRPTTYLAGRYGTGVNTYKILKKLGYTLDVSISAFANFTTQNGPDFSKYNNSELVIDGIACVPHTTGYISVLNTFANYLNRDSDNLTKLNDSFLGKVVLKLLGVKRVRLSPEGFSYKEMKKLVNSLSDIGVEKQILSFHSPSVKEGLTPYVQNSMQLEKFKQDTIKLLQDFT
jgi:hypothetical protein